MTLLLFSDLRLDARFGWLGARPALAAANCAFLSRVLATGSPPPTDPSRGPSDEPSSDLRRGHADEDERRSEKHHG